MTKITQVPTSVSGAGLNAEYPGPEDIATVTLVSAPLDPEYINIAESRDQVDAYVDGEINAGRSWNSNDVRSFTHDQLELPIKFAQAQQYNYMRVRQAGAAWYYFASCDPATANSTVWTLVQDAWTTSNPTVSGMLVQGHNGIKMAQSDSSILAEAEPIDAGEHFTIRSERREIFPDGYDVVALSMTKLERDPYQGPAFADTEDTYIPMKTATVALAQNGDEYDPVDTIVSGTVPGGAWPFPTGDANYIIGYHMGDSEPAPWLLPFARMLPAPGEDSSSYVNGVRQPGGIYAFTPNAWSRVTWSLSGAPWVVEGIQSVYLVPKGTYGTASDASVGPRLTAGVGSQFSRFRGVNADSFKSNVNYSTSGVETLVPEWRSLFGGGALEAKLASPQFASIAVGDLRGSEKIYSPLQFDSRSAIQIEWRRTLGEVSEFSFWTPNVLGERESPFNLSWSVTLPRMKNGFSRAFYPGAYSYLNDRKLSIAKYYSDIRQQAYARYASEAKDGFNTTLVRALGRIGIKP